MLWILEKKEAAHRAQLADRELDHKINMGQVAAQAQQDRAVHVRRLEIRLWWLQVLPLMFGIAAVSANVVIALVYTKNGDPGPGLAVFGAGGALVAGVYAVSRDAGRQLQQSLRSADRQQPPVDPSESADRN
jgi:hypothetical protein